jgi:uncharacterized membrane-anchored protein YhcB (DUF1043 family)
MAWEYALIIGIVVGIILGVIIVRLSGGGSQQKALQAELDKTKEELTQYRADITDHFQRSSVLLNNMVKEYSQLYNHFSKASHDLSADAENKSLPNPFDFRVVDASSTEIDDADETLSAANEHELDTADESASNTVKKTEEAPPRDYSEGASGLLRTERKE